MAKPLKETFLARVWRLLHGIVFYNTVYWRRASDGLEPPRLSHEERKQIRPVRDLAVIRPRANPRARLDAIESSTPDVSVPVLPEAMLRQMALNGELPSPRSAPAPASMSASEQASLGKRTKGRKKRRQVRMHSQGFLSRWFG